MFRICALVVIAFVAAGPSLVHTSELRQRGPADTGPGTLAAARRFLEGRWSLLSFEVFPPGAAVIRLTGAGTLTYDGFGNLAVDIRVDEATGKALRAAGIPLERGVLSSRGRTVVNMQARTLAYVLEGDSARGAPVGPLGLHKPRHWKVEGNVLTLSTIGEDGRTASIGRWEKAR